MDMTVAMVMMICRTSLQGLSNVYGKEICPKIVNMDMRINRENSKYHRLIFLRELPSIVSAFRFRMVGCLTGCASYVPSSDCYKYIFSPPAFTVERSIIPRAPWRSHPPRFRPGLRHPPQSLLHSPLRLRL